MRMSVNVNYPWKQELKVRPPRVSLQDGWRQKRTVCTEGGNSRYEACDSTYLDFRPQDKVCITRICEAKYSAKLLRGEITDVANFEFGGLARDPRQ